MVVVVVVLAGGQLFRGGEVLVVPLAAPQEKATGGDITPSPGRPIGVGRHHGDGDGHGGLEEVNHLLLRQCGEGHRADLW